jgi:hypothetical protein
MVKRISFQTAAYLNFKLQKGFIKIYILLELIPPPAQEIGGSPYAKSAFKTTRVIQGRAE